MIFFFLENFMIFAGNFDFYVQIFQSPEKF